MKPISGAPSPEFTLLAQRPDSLGSGGRFRILVSLCIVSFAFAGVFVALGAWLVMPYSVLEMALVYGAFRYMDRRARDWERLTLQGDTLIVACGTGGRVTRTAFSRYWVQMHLEASESGLRLRFSESGRSANFGSYLAADEVAQVANDVRAWAMRPMPGASLSGKDSV